MLCGWSRGRKIVRHPTHPTLFLISLSLFVSYYYYLLKQALRERKAPVGSFGFTRYHHLPHQPISQVTSEPLIYCDANIIIDHIYYFFNKK